MSEITETKAERQAREAKAEQYWRENNLLLAFFATLAVGAIALALFGWLARASSAQSFSVGLLAGAAAGLVGALLGFLFGLPRSTNGGAPGEEAPEGQVLAATQQRAVNNNLLEISDWLTKIIVGAGLVGLTDLVGWLADVGYRVGIGAGVSADTAGVFGGAVLLFFFTWGFLFVYIQTRTIISVVFASTERSLLAFESVRRAEGRAAGDGAAPAKPGGPGGPGVPGGSPAPASPLAAAVPVPVEAS